MQVHVVVVCKWIIGEDQVYSSWWWWYVGSFIVKATISIAPVSFHQNASGR